MKAATPAARVVAVSQKDRAAVTMGGKLADETWWWGGAAFESFAGKAMPDAVARTNAAVARRIATAQPAMPLPAHCAGQDRAIAVGVGKSVGTGRFARSAGDTSAFRASPESDAATLALAAAPACPDPVLAARDGGVRTAAAGPGRRYSAQPRRDDRADPPTR